jgi:hypothetical protein
MIIFDIVRTFVNAAMYPHPAQQKIKILKRFNEKKKRIGYPGRFMLPWLARTQM